MVGRSHWDPGGAMMLVEITLASKVVLVHALARFPLELPAPPGAPIGQFGASKMMSFPSDVRLMLHQSILPKLIH